MTSLLDLLGKNVAEPEVAKRLAKEFPNLKVEVSDISVKYLRSPADGVQFKISAPGDIVAIFMMSDGKDGFAEFRGELPARLNFAAEPEDAIRALGHPALRRPEATYGGHRLGPFLRFDLPTHSIHIQFRADHDGIDLVTAMTAREVPGRSQQK